MPKPFYGEATKQLEPGEYTAIIKEMVEVGHQYTKDGSKAFRKFHITFFYPELGTRQALSNFGINSWLSPSKAPYLGFYELITAVEGRELEYEEISKYDLWTLVGKTLVVVTEQQQQYVNIVALKHAEAQLPTDGIELVAYDYEEASQPHVLVGLGNKVGDMIRSSKEWSEANIVPLDDEKDEVTMEMPEQRDEIRVDEVPF